MKMLREWGDHPRYWTALAGLVCSPILLAGCSGDENVAPRASTYAVQGSVLLPDGKPLSGGTVHFVPTSSGPAGATGQIREDGTFQLSTYGADDGAAAGAYKVRVEPDFSAYARDRKGAPMLPFNNRFTDEDTSEWTAEVQPRDNKLPPFQLEKKPTARSTGRRGQG